jgi:hypothetical protein
MCHARKVEIVLRYFDECPNWKTTDVRLREAHAATGHGEEPGPVREGRDAAGGCTVRLRGSPTVLIEGRDPFAIAGAPSGPACRVYSTPDGLAGSPTVEQLKEALR